MVAACLVKGGFLIAVRLRGLALAVCPAHGTWGVPLISRAIGAPNAKSRSVR